ncbi:hypothetical protein SO574_02870 [Vibrio alfacsensis]|nr:hypothetical protein [Vibrio alfacsensis]WQE76764.1 hypothetical protein SO574_02870 [Vibrio alfacsensis]
MFNYIVDERLKARHYYQNCVSFYGDNSTKIDQANEQAYDSNFVPLM